MPVNDKRKIAVVGVGAVGSATAYAVMMSGLISELVLVDINRERAEGEAMDLAHGASFIKPIRIYAGEYEDCRDADIVIFCAGVNQKPGETRLDLVQRNFAILKDVLVRLLPLEEHGVFLMVTNPVDILTYAALRLTSLPPSRVIGSGTVLDSSRFRYLLSQYCQVEPRNIHAYVVGEHGDTEVPLWSLANIAGMPVQEFCCWRGVPCLDPEEISRRVREAAYEVIARKGATCYAIGLAVKRICESILRDENSILTVSGLVDGEYGITGVCLSLPSIVNRTGRARVLAVPLAAREEEALHHSARTLQSIIAQLDLP
ncbi:L-lactate dehydrogenase [Desulfofundulus thermocisternus]|uniref:L-lactate dehydrogenase n=1 Tax=Desulfofundulus thermocisternus TaxID=42471 RepID=UPI00217E6083|nr:L-lactate dehydrogenase [Desulfofundulus thermocisternus]MCS5695079.1 L-lactate dehydrogenase [Desulfofundulus thermocisternus]